MDINESTDLTVKSNNVVPEIGPDIPMDGLVSYWNMDTGAGSSLIDIENGRDGTIHNAAWKTDSERGTVLNFDGNNDYVVLNGWSGITNRQPRTWAIWFKSSSSRDHRIVSYGVNTTGRKYDIRIDTKNGDVLRVENADGQKIGSRSVIDGNWHLLTVVFPADGSAVHDHSLYVDAQLEAETSGTDQTLNTASSTDVFIGKSHWHDDDTEGSIGGVYAYNRGLPQEDIQKLYTETR